MDLNEMSILSSFPCDQNANAKTIFFTCYSFKQRESQSLPPRCDTYNQSQLICYCFYFKQVALWSVLSMDYLICYSQIHEVDTITIVILQMSKLRLREVIFSKVTQLLNGRVRLQTLWTNFGRQSLSHYLCFLQPVSSTVTVLMLPVFTRNFQYSFDFVSL